MEIAAATGMVIGYTLIGFVGFLLMLWIFYAVVKTAVKNGILEAKEKSKKVIDNIE